MSSPRHYVPCISRNVVCALYHEARHRRKPMTRLVDELLTVALQGTTGWQLAQMQAQTSSAIQEHPDHADTASKR
ncbi:hypothetical protein DES53_111140 [Roseimicrobium gellanilyticum]|uniref:Uncharacterized protein n=1 Tax=Roseimicrobium gellanilyticum TaxID=748857 RepID=A0A366HAV9_9BACT|nr:hypothetical protein [Roseimicrobium gellanilyticum]RBP38621.1 hypothetical protein DES53_111140 [Roseimicrobium gellanilyticum]